MGCKMKDTILFITILPLIFFTVSSAQDFWQPTNGPFGGAQVNDFLYYGDSTIFLATSEGLIKSINNGNTWKRNPDLTKFIYCLSMDSLSVLYAAASQETNPYLLKSVDGGNTWIRINNNFWADFRDIMIFYKDTIIIGSTDKGLYRTIDGGINWIQINNGLDHLHINRIRLLSNGELLVGTDGSGIYRSSDWGNNWISSNNGIPNGGNGYRYAYSILEVDSGKVFCGTQNGIYYSTNFGNNWIYRSIGYGNKRALDLIMDQYNNLYAGTDIGGGVYSSTNEGEDWNYIGLNYSIYTLGWDANSDLCAGGLGYGLNRFTLEDSTWTQIYNQGYTPLKMNVLNVTENENLYAGSWLWGLYRSTDRGQFWERTNLPYVDENIISIDDSTIVVGENTGVYLSRDWGNTWEQIADYWATSFYYNLNNQILYVGTCSVNNGICGIYASTDWGQNWSLVCSVEVSGQATYIKKFLLTNSNQYIIASVVYVDPMGGNWYRFYRSTNNGQTWETKSTIEIFDILENYHGILYTINYWELLVSYDEGSTWVSRDTKGTCLASDNLGRIYVGGAGRPVRAFDEDGISWAVVGDYPMYVNDITVSTNNHIYVATDIGVYFGDANNLVLSINEVITKIHSFSLSQNYPNPFNPTTKIKYHLPELSKVKLTVYDVLGREVRTLVNEEKPAGSYEVEFDGTNLPSGVYFYRIEAIPNGRQAGKFSETKKFVLLK